MKRTPAERDPEAVATDAPLRYDYRADGAPEAIRPTIDALARTLDRIATKKAQRDAAAEDAA